MKVLFTALGAIVAFPLLLLYGAFVNGYILFKFWIWFMLPVFTELTTISISQAMGLMLVIGLFKSHSTSTYKVDGKKVETDANWVLALILPWFILLIGWFIHICIK